MQIAGILYIVATPIGNLSDITLRALETLKAVDAILCEDTRVTGKLLARYEIRKSLVSCHEHTDGRKLEQIVGRLKSGENLAFVTDAGTPGLSDPGNKLVSLAAAAEVPIVPIPGVSALSALVSVAGIDMREFVFLGFPPHKKGRQTFFKKIAASEIPAVYYESPHRVMKNLDLLSEYAPEIRMVIGRELTKVFEEIIRGTIGEAKAYFAAHPDKVKGEFVIIAYKT
ncbi:MAG: 16S rRNA (cytidine(1402)-2'-O)-methyltransferase [Patescibacteria group bacterium]